MIFVKLVVDCINTHAPLRKVKLTRPEAHWMNDPKIANLQKYLGTPYDFTEFFQNISDDVNADTFKIKHTNYDEVRKILLGIKNKLFYGPWRHSNTILKTSCR